MNIYYDLHIHTCLSPCGDIDMTPNNIINMSLLKGLDMIAITDHNTTKNLPAFKTLAESLDITVIPGIEINTAEDVHVLAYFPDFDLACNFGDFVYSKLPNISVDEKYFGPQIILDQNDSEIGRLEKLLYGALPYSFDECLKLICDAGGVPVPAHINREANSLIYMLGFIPDSELYHTVEIYREGPLVDVKMLSVLYSSDAHYLENINERIHYFSLTDNSPDSFITFIK